jgi:hypothetical protein
VAVAAVPKVRRGAAGAAKILSVSLNWRLSAREL